MANNVADLTSFDWGREFSGAATRVVTTTVDLLVQSVAIHRLKTYSFNDENLFEQITQEDISKAEEIRNYHKRRFVMFALIGRLLSPFRKDVCAFIYSDGLSYNDKTIPMVYRIPEFYDHDMKFAELVKDVDTSVDFTSLTTFIGNKTLFPVGSLEIARRNTKATEYWFKDEKNHLFLIQVETSNPLKSLWESVYSKNSVEIFGTYRPKRRDEITYFALERWNIAK